jgi:hypothetical protein
MKKLFSTVDAKSLVIGAILGVGVGLYMFSLLVPSGIDMIRVYNLKRFQNAKNNTVMIGEESSHTMNPYNMGKITSEKQFIQEMVKHHEAAVTMAQQVLLLNPRAEVKKLANDIISAQTSEITMMKQWLASWWK